MRGYVHDGRGLIDRPRGVAGRLAVALVTVLLATGVRGQAAASPARLSAAATSLACVPRSGAPSVGLTLVNAQPVDPRTTDLTLSSRALDGTVHADVLLPVGYDPHGPRRYPVLYLLHGHGGSHVDWTQHGVEGIVGTLPVIVVMPDGGDDGWYSDWYGDKPGAMGPPPAWETFHLRELVPYVDAHYRTIPDRAGRAIAGLSMGGFGAMSYAARHPDLFVAAAAFSGAVDTDLGYPSTFANLPDQTPDTCIWGDPVTEDVIWRDHDPTELARNLGGVDLFMASGDGLPGPADDPTNVGAEATEAYIRRMTQAFDGQLTQDGVPHATDFYSPGVHDWPYWENDLRQWLPRMMDALAHPPVSPPATPFSFASADAPFSVWGWTFQPHRDVTEFTYLGGVSASGFQAAGSGVLHVDTAPLYRPGGRYTVTGLGPSAPTLYRADPSGRLHVDVDLGPSHETQQYAFGPAAEAAFAHATVAISPAA